MTRAKRHPYPACTIKKIAPGEKFPVIYGVGYKRDANGNRLVDENGLPVAGEAQVIRKSFSGFRNGFQYVIASVEMYHQCCT